MKRLILASAATLLLAGPLVAQTPSRNAADIVCELTGDCSPPAKGASTIPVGNEAAFSFAKSSAAKSARPTRVAGRSAAMVAAGSTAAVAAARAPAARGIDMRITFATGSAEMTPQGRVEAQQFARALAMPQLAGRRFVVEGHTDAVGARDYNLDLSKRRADSVTAYLASLGVPSDRLDARGYGFDRPVSGNKFAAQNRRVQFVPAS